MGGKALVCEQWCGSVGAQAVFMVFKARSWHCLPEQAGLESCVWFQNHTQFAVVEQDISKQARHWLPSRLIRAAPALCVLEYSQSPQLQCSAAAANLSCSPLSCKKENNQNLLHFDNLWLHQPPKLLKLEGEKNALRSKTYS